MTREVSASLFAWSSRLRPVVLLARLVIQEVS
jgi:hypothetical protein